MVAGEKASSLVDQESTFQMKVTEVEDFLSNPPPDFEVEVRGAGYRFVKCDPEKSCVFIDEFQSSKGKVVFQNSPGRAMTVHNLREYSTLRKNLTSKLIYVLVSACEETPACSKRKAEKSAKVLQRYVVVIDGKHPSIKWDMETGMDRAISSVAGESYRLDIDLTNALQSWAGESFRISANGQEVKPVWNNALFTIKYHADALFDFPHWLGFSKRKIEIAYRGR